jgi:uncharacterized RDD family membrane protein YckC
VGIFGNYCFPRRSDDSMSNANFSEIKKRFRYSIAIDVGLMFLFCLISGVIAVWRIEGDVSFIIPLQFSSISLYYLFGDTIFRNQSVGMKLMNIEVMAMSSMKYPSIMSLAKRRLLILLRKSSFIYRASDLEIDKKSDTHLIITKKK